ncbi:TRAP transporter small permease [Rhodobacteraceae bacterium CCMM004]|nr:TRAP transporter small permease [Rhodobacteraceae bacterium CCMM004]
MALIGGAVLIALVAMTCLSIAGRAAIPLGLGPIPGDFELIEMGMAFAVFACLPWCQYARGHARVDLFRPAFGRRGNAVLDLVADVAMALAAALIAWRLALGLDDKMSYGETTFILRWPVWWAYAAALAGAVAFALVAAFCVLRSARALARGEAAP